MMERTLFVVSDIHGHYTEMKKALEEAGFCEEKDDHVFVSCGDSMTKQCHFISI